MIRLRKLLADSKGAAVIEFAIAVPALVSLIWGIFQVGMLYHANAGMQHALGEAARYATIFPTPTDAQIQARITSARFGVGNGTWSTPTITTDTTARTKTITVVYTKQTNFIFFAGPSVRMTASKTAYLAV